MLLLGNNVTDVEQRLLLLQDVANIKRNLLCLGADVGSSITQSVLLALLGSNLQLVHAASLCYNAVLLQLPLHSIGRKAREEVFVINLNLTILQINSLGPDALILTLHLPRVRLRSAVSGDDTVMVE